MSDEPVTPPNETIGPIDETPVVSPLMAAELGESAPAGRTLPPVPRAFTDDEYEAYVNRWIGIRYLLNSSDPTNGLDCRTLAALFLKNQGIAIRDEDGAPLPAEIDEAVIARYEAGVKAAGVAVPISALQRNDVVYYRNRFGRLHVGVWLGYDRMLTIDQQFGVFIAKVRPELLQGAVRGQAGVWLDMPPGHDPITAILVAVGSFVTAGAATGVAAGIIGAIVIGAAIMAVSFGIGALTSGRRAFDFQGTAGAGIQASPRYAFDGARNMRTNQNPVPLIYGELGIRVLNTYEIWNSGANAETQKRLVVIGEGELGSITEVQLNGTDIATFTGSSFTAYTGTATQGVDARAAGTNVVGLKNTAYLALTLAASDKLSGDPVITCKVTGRKINTWNGTDWTTAAVSASGNPAAIIRDYLTLTRERGGCGFPTTMIDDASFGAAYDYFQALVTNLDATTEFRARLDFIIDAFRPWLDNLQDLMATCGAFMVTDGRKFYLRVEKSESAVQAFTQDNITDLEYATFSKDERPNRVYGVYIDPTSAGNDARTRISIDDLVDQAKNPRGIVPREVALLGISRQTQCIREITKILNDIRANWYSISFLANIDAIALEPGDVFSVVHPFLGDGTTAYQFRAVRIMEAENHRRRIYGKAYTSSIFGDTMEQQSVTLQFIPPPNPFAAVADVTGLTLAEVVTRQNDGTAFITVDASWTAPVERLNLKYYEVAIKKSTDANYQVLGFTKDTFFTAVWDFLVAGIYTVRVRTVTFTDVFSTGAISAGLTITGLPPVPANVATFAATFTKEIVLKWDKNTETDLAGYEIRTADSTWGVQNSALVWRGNAQTFTIVTPASRTPGTYYIRAYNRSGSFSATSVSVTPTNAAPAIPTLAVTQWFGFAKIEWTDVTDADLLNYEVWKSATNAWAGEEFLDSKVPGTEVIVQGNDPVDATASAVSATTMTDAALAGKGVNYFVGDRIKQTSGTFAGQEATVTAFDNVTGQITVASWPSGTPSVGNQFVLKDRAYYKVRAVDSYGAGSFTAAQTIDFTPLVAAELGDQIISARKLITGELITLSAQIKDAIITNAKILDLDGGKITAATITAGKLNVSQLSAITADMGAITAGTLVLPSGGHVRSGQTAYNTGVGFFLGNVTGTPQFSIGNPAGNRMTWDGTTLTIRGSLNADDITAGSVTAARINNGGLSFGGIDVFAASGTWTRPANIDKVWVRCWGAGGGGGGGGGNGASGSPGSSGGSTSFGASVVAGGGAAGPAGIAGASGSVSGGVGGTATAGNVQRPGQAGSSGQGFTTAPTTIGGGGGDAGLGGGSGGPGVLSTLVTNGNAGVSPGGGGSGGTGQNTSNPIGGGGGGGGAYAEGVVSVTGNVTVTVGTGGAGGAGANASAAGNGAAGADGLVIVTW